MAEEDVDIDLDLEGQESKSEIRIKDLSHKVKVTSEERDELNKVKETLEQEKASLSKEVDFFKNFTPLTAKYQGALEYQDQIKEKHLAGYELEDATIAVLAKEGKFTPQAAPPAPKENPAGGSASNATPGEKTLQDMNRDELREQLIEAEKRGDIALT